MFQGLTLFDAPNKASRLHIVVQDIAEFDEEDLPEGDPQELVPRARAILERWQELLDRYALWLSNRKVTTMFTAKTGSFRYIKAASHGKCEQALALPEVAPNLTVLVMLCFSSGMVA